MREVVTLCLGSPGRARLTAGPFVVFPRTDSHVAYCDPPHRVLRSRARSPYNVHEISIAWQRNPQVAGFSRRSRITTVSRISNGTAYGLSSSVCTNRLDYITRFVSELNVGTVNVREVPGYRLELTPFGGIKDSGLGYKEGVAEAMKSFTNVKTYSIPF